MPWKEAPREFSTARISLISHSDRARAFLVGRQWEPVRQELQASTCVVPSSVLRARRDYVCMTSLCPKAKTMKNIYTHVDTHESRMLLLRAMLAAESACFYLEKKNLHLLFYCNELWFEVKGRHSKRPWSQVKHIYLQMEIKVEKRRIQGSQLWAWRTKARRLCEGQRLCVACKWRENEGQSGWELGILSPSSSYVPMSWAYLLSRCVL